MADKPPENPDARRAYQRMANRLRRVGATLQDAQILASGHLAARNARTPEWHGVLQGYATHMLMVADGGGAGSWCGEVKPV